MGTGGLLDYILPQESYLVSENFSQQFKFEIIEKFRGIEEILENNIVLVTLRNFDDCAPEAIVEIPFSDLEFNQVSPTQHTCFDFYVITMNSKEFFYFHPVYPFFNEY